jgi:hypothetical protein
LGQGLKLLPRARAEGKIKARATVEGCTSLEVAALREKATNADRGVDPAV